jgi:hypothetical protein
MGKPEQRGEMKTLPNGKKVSWAQYRQLLREITDEQLEEYLRSQGVAKKP